MTTPLIRRVRQRGGDAPRGPRYFYGSPPQAPALGDLLLDTEGVDADGAIQEVFGDRG